MDEPLYSPDEMKAIEELKKRSMPRDREAETIIRLRAKGLLHTGTSRKLEIHWAWAVAACLLFFIAGMSWQVGSSDASYTYALLLHEDSTFNEIDSGEAFEEYAQWAATLSSNGVPVTGEKLGNHRVFVNTGSASGPGRESVMTGFFLVNARSLEEVKEITRKSPHIKYGGVVEIRPIENE
jgi:hypothetical protein